MDPASVLKTLWRHRIIALVVVVATVGAAGLAWMYAPRTFQTQATYAIVNPDLPSQTELAQSATLRKLNSNNPYLRSSDPTLIADVVITTLNSQDTVEALKNAGLSTDFDADQASSQNQGLLVGITARADSAAGAMATADKLSALLVQNLRSMQKIDGAADLYLFTPLRVQAPTHATEQFSSTLRVLLMIVGGGFVVLFIAVSVAHSLDEARRRRAEQGVDEDEPEATGPIALNPDVPVRAKNPPRKTAAS